MLKFTAPSYWASYLINNDASGLTADDIEACNRWLQNEGIAYVLDCVDAGFRWRHDASEYALGGDCQTYTCKMEPDYDQQ